MSRSSLLCLDSLSLDSILWPSVTPVLLRLLLELDTHESVPLFLKMIANIIASKLITFFRGLICLDSR